MTLSNPVVITFVCWVEVFGMFGWKFRIPFSSLFSKSPPPLSAVLSPAYPTFSKQKDIGRGCLGTAIFLPSTSSRTDFFLPNTLNPRVLNGSSYKKTSKDGEQTRKFSKCCVLTTLTPIPNIFPFMNNKFFDMFRVKNLRTHSGKLYLPYFSKHDLWTGWKIPLEVPGVV